MMERKCGVLLPVTSLPSPYGIGCFSREAYEFIDFLKNAGQRYWQILPLGQTGYGDSPYQSFSTFAGNPYFIDPEELIREGWITGEQAMECESEGCEEKISYEHLYFHRYPVLRTAYENSPYSLKNREQCPEADQELRKFSHENASWLPDYALYSALKNAFGGKGFREWPDDIRLRREEAMEYYRGELEDDIRFCTFLQLLFRRQWQLLKRYANESGIQIIGDLPIYVAADSADVWSHPELFELDSMGFPTLVAGVPPDGFSATGQLWGNPVYRWSVHAETGYAWWKERMQHTLSQCDVVRIDHFRGFDAFYAIPAQDQTAENGHWVEGPGAALFQSLSEVCAGDAIIAEDLGYITPSLEKLLKDCGYPGMKILQFAFDSRDSSDYLPHNYEKNCVVYTGTHDNETTRGWFSSITEEDRRFAAEYAGIGSEEDAAEKMIRLAFLSVGNTVVIPMQDYLNLDNRARINQPSTLGGNWTWRMQRGALQPGLAAHMHDLARIYRRL